MTIGIIDDLKVIHIQHDDRHRLLCAQRLLQKLPQAALGLAAVEQSRKPIYLRLILQLPVGFLQFLVGHFDKMHQPGHDRTMPVEFGPRRHHVGLTPLTDTLTHTHSHQRHIGDHQFPMVIAHEFPIGIKSRGRCQMAADGQFLFRIAAQKHPSRHTADHKNGLRQEAGHLFLYIHGVVNDFTGVAIGQPQLLPLMQVSTEHHAAITQAAPGMTGQHRVMPFKIKRENQ